MTVQEIDTAEAKRYSQEIGALFFETSAKSGDATGKVQDMFVEVARMLPASAAEPAFSGTTDLRKNAGGGGGKKEKEGGGGCC